MGNILHLESINKDVEIKVYNRAVARAEEAETMKNVMVIVDSDGKQTTNMPASNINTAEELVIRIMSGLSGDDMDNLSPADYETLKKAVAEAKGDKKK